MSIIFKNFCVKTGVCVVPHSTVVIHVYVLFRLVICCKTGCEFEQYYRSAEAGRRYRLVG